jgi:hypothetical protein
MGTHEWVARLMRSISWPQVEHLIEGKKLSGLIVVAIFCYGFFERLFLSLLILIQQLSATNAAEFRFRDGDKLIIARAQSRFRDWYYHMQAYLVALEEGWRRIFVWID